MKSKITLVFENSVPEESVAMACKVTGGKLAENIRDEFKSMLVGVEKTKDPIGGEQHLIVSEVVIYKNNGSEQVVSRWSNED